VRIARLLSSADLTALGWVLPTLANVPPGAVNFSWLKGFDFKAAWPLHVTERLRVEPSVSLFNLFNFANQFLGGNLPQEQLTPGSGGFLATNAVGGVTRQGLLPFRATFGSGTYAFGAPRQIEFGLKVDF
jgi:hypothetical protein